MERDQITEPPAVRKGGVKAERLSQRRRVTAIAENMRVVTANVFDRDALVEVSDGVLRQ